MSCPHLSMDGVIYPWLWLCTMCNQLVKLKHIMGMPSCFIELETMGRISAPEGATNHSASL